MERVPEIRNVLLEREHVQNKAESKICRYVDSQALLADFSSW